MNVIFYSPRKSIKVFMGIYEMKSLKDISILIEM